MPFATGEVAPEPDNVLIVFWETFVVVAPVMAIPTTVDDAPVDDNVLIVLLLMFTTGEVLDELIAVTPPPVPVEDRPVTIFEDAASGLALFPDEPMLMPVILPWPVILVTVLLDRVEVVAPKYE